MSVYTLKKEWNFPFPENLKKYRNLSVMSKLLTDDIVDEVLPLIDTLALYLNMELLSDPILDELAIMWNVQFYSTTFPKEKKIELIRNAYYFNSQKGTTGIVEEALKTVYGDIKLEEWFEYGGNPYYFRITSDKIFSEEELNKIIDIVEVYKNTRSTLEFILAEIYNSGFISVVSANINYGLNTYYPKDIF